MAPIACHKRLRHDLGELFFRMGWRGARKWAWDGSEGGAESHTAGAIFNLGRLGGSKHDPQWWKVLRYRVDHVPHFPKR